MVKPITRLDGEEVSGSRVVEVMQEEAVEIQKAALVMLMQADAETRLAHVSLPERYTTDHIRAVYQNLPEFDAESLKARSIITRAASLLAQPAGELTVDGLWEALKRECAKSPDKEKVETIVFLNREKLDRAFCSWRETQQKGS